MTVHRLYENHPEPVEIEFDPDSHKYVLLPDRIPITANVTAVTDKISTGDKTGALIGWACKEMAAYLEESWPKGLAIEGTDGFPYIREWMLESQFQDLLKKAKGAHRRKKKEAATIGGQAHDWIDKHIKAQLEFGAEPELPVDERVLNAVTSYLEFEQSRKIHYVASERKVYSKWHNYVGTLDRLVEMDGLLGIQDLKTSNAWRTEYQCQIAAYEMAWEEEFPDRPVQFRMGLMLGKDEPKFEIIPMRVEDRVADFEAFLGALAVFRWEEGLRERRAA